MALADEKVRITELLAALSLASDLATYQPFGHGLGTSLLAVALAEKMGLDRERVRSTQQVALLRFVGCTSDASGAAVLAGGEEAAHYQAMAPVLMGSSAEILRALAATVGAGQPLPRRLRLLGLPG